ncbi:MAG: hypothetical protein WD080_05455 [Egibacteraceae bacterium]
MGVRTKTFLVATAVAMTMVVGTAFACTNLATLNLSAAAGQAGDSITVTGSSFSVPSEGETPAVVMTWNGAEGEELASVTPDSAGNVSATFEIPDGQPGYYVIVASQMDEEGEPMYGTPARASFQILGPGGESVVQPAAPTPAVADGGSTTGIVAMTAILGVLGLALFGAGFSAFVKQLRGREEPETAPVRRD